MRRVLAPFLAALLVLALAAPALGAKPIGGCPPVPGWALIDGETFYQMSLDNGFPPLEGEELEAWFAGFLALDGNGDGKLCYKHFQPTRTPAFPDYYWNVVDNVSNH
jgi:hypothetical protein